MPFAIHKKGLFLDVEETNVGSLLFFNSVQGVSVFSVFIFQCLFSFSGITFNSLRKLP